MATGVRRAGSLAHGGGNSPNGNAAPTQAPALIVELLTTPTALDAVAPEWDALAARDPVSTPYQTAKITLGLWRTFTPTAPPVVVIVREDDGRLSAVLPMGLFQRRIGPMRLRMLEPLVRWHASYFDAILDPSRSALVAPLVQALRRPDAGADAIMLPHLRPDANLIAALPPTPGMVVGRETVRHEIPLDPKGIRAQRNGREFRRTWHRLLTVVPDARYEFMTDRGLVQRWLPAFAALHRTRWQHTPTHSMFSGKLTTARFVDWFASMAACGVAELHAIRTEDAMLAGLCVFRHRGRLFGWRQVSDRVYSQYGVGIQLMAQTLASAAARGDTLYDLGRGMEPYKDKWENRVTPLWRRRVGTMGWRWQVLQRLGRWTGRQWTDRWLAQVDAPPSSPPPDAGE